MHELALTEALLAAALAAARTHPRDADQPAHAEWRIAAIHLRVGALTGVVPECMRFFFAQIAAGTAAAGAALCIETEAAVATCCSCGFSAPAALPLAPCCARCGGRLEICGGDALLLERLVLVADEPSAALQPAAPKLAAPLPAAPQPALPPGQSDAEVEPAPALDDAGSGVEMKAADFIKQSV